MADRIDTRDKGRSSWMIFAIVAVVVIAITSAFVWMSEGPFGEAVGIEPAPTETDLSDDVQTQGTQQPPEVELSGENVQPEATDNFVSTTPLEADQEPEQDSESPMEDESN